MPSLPEKTREEMQESALLIGIQWDNEAEQDARDSLSELERLVDSTGAEVRDSRLIRLRNPRASTLISQGHLRDLTDWASRRETNLVVIDGELSPVQQRNLEDAFERRVLTRTEVILDIFATHAKTREAMTQVELAQLRYRLPRLIGMPIATARMGGVSGRIATRGPGETQLEVDRRRIRERINRLEKRLEDIRRQRETQRRRRVESALPLIGLVGYTNAGKSTLLNRLTEAGVLTEDRLFSTLDTTVRTLELPSGLEAGLIDTVGFIGKLPPQLIAAFRATLEEITYSDLILHIVDASSRRRAAEFAATDDILEELGCKSIPRLTVWNKIDLIEDPVKVNLLVLERKPSVAISALEGTNVDRLLEELESRIMSSGVLVNLLIPYEDYDVAARLHREGQVLETRDSRDGRLLRCRLTPELANVVEPYRIGEWPEE